MGLFGPGSQAHDARMSNVTNGSLLLGASQLTDLSKGLSLVWDRVVPGWPP